MTKSTERRHKKQELLNNLKRQARMNIYELKKMRFDVEIWDNLPKTKWRELTFSEIYEAETFFVRHNNGQTLIEDCPFQVLDCFTKFLKQYRKTKGHGIKCLGDNLDDMMMDFIKKHSTYKQFCLIGEEKVQWN